MSKTFKDARESVTNVLTISFDVNGLSLRTDTYMQSAGIILAPSDAPALCLAILEAAGVNPEPSNDDPGTPGNLGRIAYQLMIHIEDAENIAAAEADRAALEQEALKLYNTGRKHQCMVNDATWDDLDNTTQKYWLAVARAARELNKEAGQ